MSVAAFINNAINDEEEKFYLPVSSESFFYSHWLPACELLNLRLVPCFAFGIDIYKENLLEVIAELNQLKAWTLKNLSGSDLEYMTKRIDLLITKLPLVFTRDGISVFIG